MSPSLEEIRERDGDRCARCGSADSPHVHHRQLRSQLGPDTWSNCVTLCALCHHWVHHNIAEALTGGWLVDSGTDPALVPVQHWMWPSGRVRLMDNGVFDISLWATEGPGTAHGDGYLASWTLDEP